MLTVIMKSYACEFARSSRDRVSAVLSTKVLVASVDRGEHAYLSQDYCTCEETEHWTFSAVIALGAVWLVVE